MAKSTQSNKNKGLKPNSPSLGIVIPKRTRFRAKDILSIHSQLIRKFISGELKSQEAKDLSYLCSNYLNALQVTEFESRLKSLEEQAKK